MPFAWGIALLLADQWSKRIVQIRAANRNLSWGSIVRFQPAHHFEQSYNRISTRAVLIFVWMLALVCAIILSRAGLYFESAASLAGLGLALGGAASNLADILWRGYVLNFIDLGWWPVFNLADVAIVAGLAAAFFA